MLSKKEYYILAFQTTADAMQAEKYAEERVPITVMPLPCEIGSGCGLAIRFLEPEEEKILQFCKSFPITGELYKMQSKRVNGRHPVEKLMIFGRRN